jgi:hypothetical protein
MGQSASPSLYDYASGDPVNRFDPDGRCPKGQNGQDNGDGTFMWNGSRVPYRQLDGTLITPNDLAANQADQINALNSSGGQGSSNTVGQYCANLLQGFGNGLQSAATGALNALLDPFGAIQGLADGLGNTAGRLWCDPGSVGTQVVNTLTDPSQLGNTLGNVAGGTIIGAGVGAVGGAVIGQAADVGGAAGTITNPVPDTLARVIPGEGPFPTLGLPGDADVYVTDPAAIKGMTPAQISERLGIPPSDTYTIIQLPTPSGGLASPILRTNPGFVGGGLTSGGAPEFVVPNGPIPPGATTTVISGP